MYIITQSHPELENPYQNDFNNTSQVILFNDTYLFSCYESLLADYMNKLAKLQSVQNSRNPPLRDGSIFFWGVVLEEKTPFYD